MSGKSIIDYTKTCRELISSCFSIKELRDQVMAKYRVRSKKDKGYGSIMKATQREWDKYQEDKKKKQRKTGKTRQTKEEDTEEMEDSEEEEPDEEEEEDEESEEDKKTESAGRQGRQEEDKVDKGKTKLEDKIVVFPLKEELNMNHSAPLINESKQILIQL